MALRSLPPLGWLPQPLRTPAYKGPGSNSWADAHAARTADEAAENHQKQAKSPAATARNEALKWFPQDYVDEVSPPGRDSPEAWLIDTPDGAAIDKADPEGAVMTITDGETIDFVTCEDLGTANLHLAPDGHSLDRPEPAGAEQCCITGDFDALGDSLDGLVKWMRENDYDPGVYEIAFYTWSNSIPLRFDAASRAFTAAGKAN